MNSIGALLRGAGDTFSQISGDKNFRKLEVLKMIARTTSMDQLPEEGFYKDLKKLLTRRGYRYACSIIEAHITKDSEVILQAYLGK